MKTLKTIFVAAMSFAAITVSAQTADEILNKHITALGGAEKLASLKTVKMEGNMSTQGIDIPITLTKVHLKGVRADFEIMGTSNYQIANETTGWIFMPFQQMEAPQEMSPEVYASFKKQMDIQTTFFNYKTKGYQVEFTGTEKVNNNDAYKLKVINSTDTSFYFIDTKSNLVVKTAATANVNGQIIEVETTFSDYKKNEEGYIFAYTTGTMQGPITFDKISTNIVVDEKLFSN